jgi:6-pyruvoyltetrahydropterin/6-carboxytetrahydropterin synthase
MFEIGVRARFAAAHWLRGYEGRCRRLHGHNWTVEARVVGPATDRAGMLLDFHALRRMLEEALEELDHACLNELPAFGEEGDNPTAENLARHIYRRVGSALRHLRPDLRLSAVRVWESPDTWAAYREDDA